MAIGRVSGPMLTSNLERQGVDLSIENDLLYVDVTNDRIGVKTAFPTVELEVNGNIKADNLSANTITIGNSTIDSLDTGNIRLEGNTISTTNTDGNLILAPDGLGNISVNGTYINDLATPVADTDAATKGYVDDLLGNVEISGNAISANNGNLVLDDDVSIVGNLQVGDVVISGSLNGIDLQTGNITIVDNTIGSANTDGNIYLEPNGTGLVVMNGDIGFLPPVGTTSSRPATPPTGLTRFNDSTHQLEFFDGTDWRTAGPEAGTITAQALYGDGSTVTFTLDRNTSTEAVIVSSNGTVQKPDTAYTVSGNQITFAEAPADGDTVDVRFITLTYSFDSINLAVYSRLDALALTDSARGDIIYVTDGDAGNPCIAVYNGTGWKRISFGGDL